LRVNSNDVDARRDAAKSAVLGVGGEEKMRGDLTRLVTGLVENINTDAALKPNDNEINAIINAADLVTRARTAVDRAPNGEVEEAHMLEMPTRFPKELVQIFRGATAIGLDRASAMRLVIRAARDSMPPPKLEIVDWLAVHASGNANEVAVGIDKPYNTTNRQLQELHLLGVVTRAKITGSDSQNRWHYRLADGIDPAVLKSGGFSRFGSSPYSTASDLADSGGCSRGVRGSEPNLESARRAACVGCGKPLETAESIDAGVCWECRDDSAESGTDGRGFQPPVGPGRCPECGWHPSMQGHAPNCSANNDSEAT
jgi:hypothetical protein